MASWFQLPKFCLLALTLLVFSCSVKPEKIEPENLAVDPLSGKLDLCKSYTNPWDSVYIVRPYARYKGLKWGLGLKNIGSISNELEAMESIDWLNYILFIQGNKHVVAYCKVPRGFLDFKFQSDHQPKSFIIRGNCNLPYDPETKSVLIGSN